MKKKNIYLILFLTPLFFLTGCFNLQTGEINDYQAEEMSKKANEVYKILSPEEYRSLINIEEAKDALERLTSFSAGKNTLEDVNNEIKKIKNNCNLSLDPSLILNTNLSNQFARGYLCKYVKGSVSGSSSRIDSFEYKFIGFLPFEFGISKKLDFKLDSGELTLENITGNSLVEKNGEIYTIKGTFVFPYIEKIIEGKDNQPTNIIAKNEDNKIKIDIPNSNANIFLAILGDDGKSGKMVGCGDSLISIGVSIDFTDNSLTGKIRQTLNHLFSLNKYDYNKELGIVNPLYKTDLDITQIRVVGSKVIIDLDGILNYNGLCDFPLIQEQIKATAMQFGNINQVELNINKTLPTDFFKL